MNSNPATVFHFLCGDGTNAAEGIFHNFNSNESDRLDATSAK